MKKIIIILFILTSSLFSEDITFIYKSIYIPNNDSKIEIPKFNSMWKNKLLNSNQNSQYSNYKLVSVFKISENFYSGIFLLSSKSTNQFKYRFTNFDKNQNIISSIDFNSEIEIKTKEKTTSFSTLFTVNEKKIFIFEKNKINSYQILTNGSISEEYELEINSVWDMTLIDDYFPAIKHIYLQLPFSLKKQQNIMKNILKDLTGLETFGVYSSGKINSQLFTKEITKNCQNLTRFIFGYEAKEKHIERLKRNCPNLTNLDIVIEYTNVDPSGNLEKTMSKYKQDLNIIEIP